MSSSSNITTRPALRKFTRASDDVAILVNMAFVREAWRLANGQVRLQFGSGGNDHVDVKTIDIDGLREL